MVLIDREKEPGLTEKGRSRLKTCGRPWSKEEWRSMTNNMKWRTLENLGPSKRGGERTAETTSEISEAWSVEQNTPPPPQSAKPPPPRPPSTYANDKPRLESISETADKGTSNGKGKEKGQPKGKNDAKGVGKSTKGKKGSMVTQREETKSEYTIYTDQEKNWAHRNSKKNGIRIDMMTAQDGNGIRMNTSMSTTVGIMGDIQRQVTQVHV